MSKVTREYLPGLKLAQQFIAESVSEEAASDLDCLIAQASAAPEQEAVGYFSFCHDKKKWIQQKLKGPEFAHLLTQLYTHADDGECARLRAELVEARRNEHNSEVAYRAAIERQEELRDELKTEGLRADAAVGDANEAERKLAEAQALVRESREAYAEAIHWEDQQPVMKKIDAFLSATAQPADGVKS